MNEKWRERIRTTMLIKRLSDHVVGKGKMSVTQVRAAETLLRKVLPDMSSVDARVEVSPYDGMTTEQLLMRARLLAKQAGMTLVEKGDGARR